MYAERLTKEELIANGINEITTDGQVFRTGLEVQPYTNSKGYLVLNLYDRDSEGNYIKIPLKRKVKGCKNLINTYRFKSKTVGLHRAMWAWFYGEVPEGYVVDHINNSHTNREDYRLENLQLLTPGENLCKERDNWHQYEMKCKLNKSREYYENKLQYYIQAYTKAKLDKDAKLCHKLRSQVSQYRAKLRYYDSHIDEVQEIKENDKMTLEEKIEKEHDRKDLQILQYWKKVFREAGNKKMWHHCCDVEKMWKEGKLNKLAKNHVIEVLLGLNK